MVARARDLGWEALVVTIDHAPGRGREHNERNGFSFPFTPNTTAALDMAMHPGWMWRVLRKYLVNEGMPTNANYPERYRHSVIDGKKRVRPKRFEAMTWEHIRKLRDFWPRKLIVKSILCGDQARAAVDAGADGIVVSNHGGRAFDSAIATIDILRGEIESRIPEGAGRVAALLHKMKDEVREAFPDMAQRRAFLREAAMGPAAEAAMAGESDKAMAVLRSAMAQPGARQGRLFLLDGSGPADLLSLRALRALAEADAIMADAACDPQVLVRARRDATRLPVDEESLETQIAAGLKVVRITAGPPPELKGATVLPVARP